MVGRQVTMTIHFSTLVWYFPIMCNFTGNFFQLFNTKGWQFHEDIVANYGGVVKLIGLLGVCTHLYYLPYSSQEALVITGWTTLRHRSTSIASHLHQRSASLRTKSSFHCVSTVFWMNPQQFRMSLPGQISSSSERVCYPLSVSKETTHVQTSSFEFIMGFG